MERCEGEKVKITLGCGSDKSRDWMCEGNVAHRIDGTFSDVDAEVY